MKALLMHRDRDFDLQGALPWNSEALVQDLELETLFHAMAIGDPFLFEAAKRAVLTGLTNDPETIRYRQDILKDCLKHDSVIREISRVAVEAIENDKKNYWRLFSKYPGAILNRSIESLQMFSLALKKLRAIADDHAGGFASDGFRAFFIMLQRELGGDFFARVDDHLKELKFRGGVLIGAELDSGNKGTGYVLRKPQGKKESWLRRIFSSQLPVYTYTIDDRDESGARALTELKDRGINHTANVLAQSVDHILGFFNLLRTELAFYIGCLNLHRGLAGLGHSTSFPLPVHPGRSRYSASGLYDACLALTMKRKVVSNDVQADGKDIVVITGANQGGKSTFLRSIGLSQLMMQCGMFVPAEFMRADLCDGLFTHYKREEDASLKSGKLDEELLRMSDIADHLTSRSMLLLNESFSSTNEREGSEIARQIIGALREKRIKVFYVTHLYEFARHDRNHPPDDTLFLRAERQPDGGRTFRIIEGEPLETSYGADLYHEVFRTGRKRPGESPPIPARLDAETATIPPGGDGPNGA